MKTKTTKRHPPKYTAGEWSVVPERLLDGYHIAGRRPRVVDVNGDTIAEVDRRGSDGGEDATAMANAALIAAAPDLLKVLEAVREDVEILTTGHAVEKREACRQRLAALDAAVAKARG